MALGIEFEVVADAIIVCLSLIGFEIRLIVIAVYVQTTPIRVGWSTVLVASITVEAKSLNFV